MPEPYKIDYEIFVSRPGDVIFINSRGFKARINVVAQYLKRLFTSPKEPFAAYSHAALSIGVGEVIHSLTTIPNKIDANNPEGGISIQSLYDIELETNSIVDWEVLRPEKDSNLYELIRESSLSFLGFSYNWRFDLKYLYSGFKYHHSVYCSEFIAKVFEECELVESSTSPHKVTPHMLYNTLTNAGWKSVKDEYLNDLGKVRDSTKAHRKKSTDFIFNLTRNTIKSNLNIYATLIEFVRAQKEIVLMQSELDKDATRYLKKIHDSYFSQSVDLRILLVINTFEQMLDIFEDVDVDEENTIPESSELDINVKQQIENLKLPAFVLKIYNSENRQYQITTINHYLKIEVCVISLLVEQMSALIETERSEQRQEIKKLYGASSVLCHFYSLTGVADRILTFDKNVGDSKFDIIRPQLKLISDIVRFYLSFQEVLLNCSDLIAVNADLNEETLSSLNATIAVYSRLGPVFSIINNSDGEAEVKLNKDYILSDEVFDNLGIGD